jgi:hypothetical protein
VEVFVLALRGEGVGVEEREGQWDREHDREEEREDMRQRWVGGGRRRRCGGRGEAAEGQRRGQDWGCAGLPERCK